jgi:molybdate transport system substrate-binding protein
MCPPDGEPRILPTLLLGAALAVTCKSPPPTGSASVQVAAASDLTSAFEELGRLFEARTGQRVTFTFGASGMLAKQIGQGAPFDLFAAANTSFVDGAVSSGACDAASKALYARGHVVVWTKRGGVHLQSLADLKSADIKHIAIANPEHAPYGMAAKEALTKAGLWPELEGKLVHAENVRQALQFAQTGNAEVAIVALSLVAKDDGGLSLAVDPALHAPIEQTLVVCKNGQNASGARKFAQLLESSEGQALLKHYGFGGSDEQTGK